MVPSSSARVDLLREFARKGGDLVALSGPALKAHMGKVAMEAGPNPMLFGQWVRKCAVAVGASPMRFVSDVHLEEAIGLALDEEPEESPFYRSRRYPGTRKALAAALSELGEAEVDGEALRGLAKRAEGGLSEKLGALARIYLRVEALERELGFASLLDMVELCLPLRSSRAEPLERALLIVGESWHPVAETFCRWFVERGGWLTILVESHVSQTYTGFLSSQQVLAAFPHAAVHDDPAPPSTFLSSIFAASGRSDRSNVAVRVVATPDPLSEAEETLRALRASLEGGALPSQLAIFARNLEQYGVPLELAEKRIGVRLALPRRAPLESNGWIRFLLQTLEALGGTDVRNLLRPVASSYLGLSRQEQEGSSEAVRQAYRAGAEQWARLEEGAADGALGRLLTWRREAIADRYSLGEWLGLLGQLRDAVVREAEADQPTVERDARAHYVLLRALNARCSIHNVGGAEKFRLSGFARLCRSMASVLDVSIPAGSGVAVVSDSEGLEAYERVWALGLLEGQFPRRRSEDPVLHDLDRSALADLGIRLRNSFDRARAERDTFYRVAASARLDLTLSYPETDEDRDNIPAFYLDEAIQAAGDRAERTRTDRSRLAPPLSDCNNDADRNLRTALDRSDKVGPLPNLFTTDLPVERLGRPPGWEPSVKDLRDVTRCPYQYFGRRLLGLRSNQMARHWAGVRQIPIRAQLAAQPTTDAARQAMIRELDEEVTRIMPDATDWELASFRVGGLRIIDEWVAREFAVRRLWRSGEVRCDVPLQEVEPEGGFRKLAVGGRVPAVTDAGTRRFLHLYEGGKPDIGEDGFKERADLVYYGVNLLASFSVEGRSMAVEIETQRDGRLLLCLPRISGLSASLAEKLAIKDLSESDHPKESLQIFTKAVRAAVHEAKDRMRMVVVTPTPGEHCRWCDLGELCRRSARFSEELEPLERRGADGEED